MFAAATSSSTASSSQSTKAKSGSVTQIFVDDPLQLPARFRRKDITDDEMEAINVIFYLIKIVIKCRSTKS